MRLVSNFFHNTIRIGRFCCYFYVNVTFTYKPVLIPLDLCPGTVTSTIIYSENFKVSPFLFRLTFYLQNICFFFYFLYKFIFGSLNGNRVTFEIRRKLKYSGEKKEEGNQSNACPYIYSELFPKLTRTKGQTNHKISYKNNFIS